MGYGLKISKPGVDVGTAGVTDLIFSSDIDSMKTKATGTFASNGTVAHGLSYTPVFFISQSGFAPYAAGGVAVDGTNLINETSGTVRYYIFYKAL